MYKIIFTDTFLDMLEDIINYYAQYSFGYSNSILLEVSRSIGILQLFPNAMPIANKSDKVRKAIIKNRFSIIFKIENDFVRLLYFLDNRMLNNSYMVEEEMELYLV